MWQNIDSETCRELKETSEPAIWMKHDIKSKNKTQSSFSSQSAPNWRGPEELVSHRSKKGAQTPLPVAVAASGNQDAQSKHFPWRILTTLTLPAADKKSEAVNIAHWGPEITIGRYWKENTDSCPQAKNSVQEARSNSFCVFQKKGCRGCVCMCMCVRTHVCTTFLEERLPRIGMNSNTVEKRFQQMVGITNSLPSIHQQNRNPHPHEADFSKGK